MVLKTVWKDTEQAPAGVAKLNDLQDRILIHFSTLKFNGEPFRLGTNGKFASMTSDSSEGTWRSMAFKTEHYKISLTCEGNLTVSVPSHLFVANYKFTDKGVEMKEMPYGKPNEPKAKELLPELEALVKNLRECGAFELQKK